MEEPLLTLHGTTNLWINGERQRFQKVLHNNIQEFAEKCQQEVEWLHEFLKNIVPKKKKIDPDKKPDKRKRNEEQQNLIESKRKIERSKVITYTDKKIPISTKSSNIPRKAIISMPSRQPQHPPSRQRETKRLRTAEFDDDTNAVVLDQNNLNNPIRQEFLLIERLRQEAQLLRQKAVEKEEEASRLEAIHFEALRREAAAQREALQESLWSKEQCQLHKNHMFTYNNSHGNVKLTTRSKSKPDWCNDPEISAALARQAQIDPDNIFKCGKSSRNRSSSEIWEAPDLTIEEEVEYKQKMGYI
ncbi:1431_t:CDS:2 [Ambispora leptoticha]|uniref:1431_t:CDS:1 n=1 Tax=Ambispora leptoticha TaxID=144679 RepID=A0A9N9FEN0_9GLOM|nr:1431_t:CDS:2 [Ambispora leptoticha]